MSIPRFLKQASMALVLTLGAQTSQATILVTFDALVNDGGLYDGTTGNGFFEYEDTMLSGSGFESLGPIGGTFVPQGLLDFSFTILGQTFGMSDDSGYMDLPIVDFFDGIPDYIDFLVEDNINQLGVIAIGLANAYPAITPANDLVSLSEVSGEYLVDAYIDTAAGVPEPDTIALLSLGLIGLGFIRRKIKA